jgi:D-alanyl-D-alanine carboxypeptidase
MRSERGGAFEALVEPVSPVLAQEMLGVSWHPGCPVPIADLRVITMDHWGFDGRSHRGELVVHKSVSDGVVSVFSRLFTAQFPILQMERIEHFAGDDDASMAADNTSAFNCRQITGGSGFSIHSWGMAIDINPVENPYIRGGVVLPPASESYLDRQDVRPGMIVDGDIVVEAFTTIGFTWGGNWERLKDYQHFEIADPVQRLVTVMTASHG